MARPKALAVKTQELYEEMLPEFGDVDEPTKKMLFSYCLTCCQLDNLNKQLASEGLLIEVNGKMKEHPAVATIHKLNSDKARYYTPLKRVLDKREVKNADELFGADDEFMGF